jgi:hypothetical protein
MSRATEFLKSRGLLNESNEMEVYLEAVPNKDFSSDSNEGSINIKGKWIKVDDLKDAQIKVRLFIKKHELGSGNFSGGQVRKDGKEIAHISHNYRIWDNQNKEIEL